MSFTQTDFTKARDFLDTLYPPKTLPESRAFLTLTFAQSLDGKIGNRDEHVQLSGKESTAMTHRLRAIHDAILVGVGTVEVDNPQLNVRHVPKEDLQNTKQPQPIILDPSLSISPDCKLLRNYRENRGKQPWIFSVESAGKERKEHGARVFYLNNDRQHTISEILQTLWQEGIKSLMVEGGGRVIQSCLLSGLVDQVIITIAPRWFGVGIDCANGPSSLVHVKYEQFGEDMVVAAQLAT